MKYLFLTGATGLVGRYLLHELQTAGVPVAVMVRPGKGRSALDAIMSHWEREVGRALPRPVTILGDLTHGEVVPDADERRWLAENCDCILHCAASMTFREDRHGEPFRSNVQGTRNLLALCRSAGLGRFHHVSTAYVCGLREGRILESDVDLGQTMGNVYEQSKLEAEKLIRGADFLEERTVYRPASVVGDSRTGYVTNFHGFYWPLQLAHAMAGRVPVREMNERFYSRLGLKGDEGKNLVPVDWLAKAIVHLVTHPEHHNKTYHLASPRPVRVVDAQRVIRDTIEQHMAKRPAPSMSEAELQTVEAMFYEYMLIYQSHWRDDPKFDLSNTLAALPHLPCPELTYDVLMRVSKYAVERNFVQPRFEYSAPDYDVAGHLKGLIVAGRNRIASADGPAIGLQVNGPGGGQWRLHVDAQRGVRADLGLPSAAAAHYYLSVATFRALAQNEMSIAESINSGRLVVQGARDRLKELIRVLEQVVSAEIGGALVSHATN